MIAKILTRGSASPNSPTYATVMDFSCLGNNCTFDGRNDSGSDIDRFQQVLNNAGLTKRSKGKIVRVRTFVPAFKDDYVLCTDPESNQRESRLKGSSPT